MLAARLVSGRGRRWRKCVRRWTGRWSCRASAQDRLFSLALRCAAPSVVVVPLSFLRTRLSLLVHFRVDLAEIAET